MNARQREELLRKLEQIETCKAAIAKSRDQLRSLVSDVEDIIASLDEADDTLASGLWPLRKGVDDTSEYL
jgi:ABC-type transporter Mla subunit MlaD